MSNEADRLLVVNINNTNVQLGLFAGETLEARWTVATNTALQRDDYAVSLSVLLDRQNVDAGSIRSAVIGSVVPPLLPVFDDLLREYFRLEPLVVRAGTRTGVRLVYDPAFEVGADRIANAVAAHVLYGSPAVVADFGTATTFDAVGEDGSYLGGAIAPGLGIAADALWQRTSQLRRITLAFPDRAIGRNTVESMQSGLLFGYLGLTKEMISRFCADLGATTRVIATGGLASLMAEHLPGVDHVDKNLTLQGLRLIHERNMKTSHEPMRNGDYGTA